jgi:hemerythrin-like domain-containing protein
MTDRRMLLLGLTPALLTAAALSACSGEDGKEVGAVEDLMREHGVLRRIILALRESGSRLAAGNTLPSQPMAEAIRLFQKFGEDYHEKKLEEAYIFPAVRKAGGPPAAMIDILLVQHQRGRDLTAYMLNVTSKGIGLSDVAALSSAFDSFELMYANHTAREDTLIFPAWKNALSDSEIEEMGDRFEDIEKQEFGTDGFDYAVKTVDHVEQELGLSNLAQFTAPAPR